MTPKNVFLINSFWPVWNGPNERRAPIQKSSFCKFTFLFLIFGDSTKNNKKQNSQVPSSNEIFCFVLIIKATVLSLSPEH